MNLKILISVLILIYNFQLLAKADDINDFQLEGMSVGDSLLNFMSISEINSNTFENYFKNGKKRKYYATGFFNTDKYDQLEIYLKTGDNNFESFTTVIITRCDFSNGRCLRANEYPTILPATILRTFTQLGDVNS